MAAGILALFRPPSTGVVGGGVTRGNGGLEVRTVRRDITHKRAQRGTSFSALAHAFPRRSRNVPEPPDAYGNPSIAW